MSPDNDATIPEDLDFSGGERGKYARRFAEKSNVVVLDPDVAAVFKNAAEVNEALRELISRRKTAGDT